MLKLQKLKIKRRRGLWHVNYTGTQSFITLDLIRWLKKWAGLLNIDLLVRNLKCPIFSTNNSIYRSGNFEIKFILMTSYLCRCIVNYNLSYIRPYSRCKYQAYNIITIKISYPYPRGVLSREGGVIGL